MIDGQNLNGLLITYQLEMKMTDSVCDRERESDGLMHMRDEDEDLLLEGALYKRQDFLDKEEAAKSHPNRTYYFRKSEDVDKLV